MKPTPFSKLQHLHGVSGVDFWGSGSGWTSSCQGSAVLQQKPWCEFCDLPLLRVSPEINKGQDNKEIPSAFLLDGLSQRYANPVTSALFRSLALVPRWVTNSRGSGCCSHSMPLSAAHLSKNTVLFLACFYLEILMVSNEARKSRKKSEEEAV